MPLLPPLNFNKWLSENRHLLQPPVGNFCLFKTEDFTVMAVGGPNARSDYHFQPTEEFFYQVKGAMLLKVIEDGKFKDIKIDEGEMFMLPANTPHSPCRFEDTVGLVVERTRPEGKEDAMRWYCPNLSAHDGQPHVVKECRFYCTDLGTQLKPVIDAWKADKAGRKCDCGYEQGERELIGTLKAATELVSQLFSSSKGKTLIMTGAGVSVDSGIAPYRGEDGHYTVHKTYRPIFFHEFTDESAKGHAARQRYWSRSFLGYPPVLRALPNKTHYSIAALQRMGYFQNFITQNVDSLHHAATPSPSLAASTILELHGTLQSVVCVTSATSPVPNQKRPVDPAQYDLLSLSYLSGGPRRQATPLAHNTPTGDAYPKGCGFRGSRLIYQEELGRRNPRWKEFAEEMAEKGTEPKTNPDGDVDLGNADYASFNYGTCPNCGGSLKPAVVFFGESVPDKLRDHSYKLIDECESLVLIGTSLATYSAYRLVKAAQEQGKRTMIINKGPTRADGIVQDKVELGSSEVMNAVAKHLAGSRGDRDPVLHRLLESGETVVPNRKKGVVSS